jgi:hypothetical protein
MELHITTAVRTTNCMTLYIVTKSDVSDIRYLCALYVCAVTGNNENEFALQNAMAATLALQVSCS